MANSKTETQKYSLIKKEKDFEIRFYPAATIAMISSRASSYKELSNPGFRKLAGYIFGGNEERSQIAMTTPVHMDIHPERSTMAFVMPSKFDNHPLPKPNDPSVKIEKVPEEYVAAIPFGGFASDDSIQKHRDILESGLKREGISYYGNFRFLAYNPPYQILGRRNEVIVSILWKA
jgi:hypothetical protein